MTNQSVKARIPDVGGLYTTRLFPASFVISEIVIRHTSSQADLMTGMAPGNLTRKTKQRMAGRRYTYTVVKLITTASAKKARDKDVWRRELRSAVEASSER